MNKLEHAPPIPATISLKSPTMFSQLEEISKLKNDPSPHPYYTFRLKKVIPMEEINNTLPSLALKLVPTQEVPLPASAQVILKMEETAMLSLEEIDTPLPLVPLEETTLPSVPLEEIDTTLHSVLLEETDTTLPSFPLLVSPATPISSLVPASTTALSLAPASASAPSLVPASASAPSLDPTIASASASSAITSASSSFYPAYAPSTTDTFPVPFP